MLESSVSEHLLERRKFLKFLGLSSAGITTAAAIAASREKISDGSELAKAEIENLKQAYEDLDKRSKLILRLILAMSGLDIFLSLWGLCDKSLKAVCPDRFLLPTNQLLGKLPGQIRTLNMFFGLKVQTRGVKMKKKPEWLKGFEKKSREAKEASAKIFSQAKEKAGKVDQQYHLGKAVKESAKELKAKVAQARDQHKLDEKFELGKQQLLDTYNSVRESETFKDVEAYAEKTKTEVDRAFTSPIKSELSRRGGAEKIEKLKGGHPMQAKKSLASSLVGQFHSMKAAKHELEQFEQVFSKNKVPDNMPSFTWNDLVGDAVSAPLFEIMAQSELFDSKGAVRRLVQQGGVKIDGEKQSDPNLELMPLQGERIFQAGKRVFFKLVG